MSFINCCIFLTRVEPVLELAPIELLLLNASSLFEAPELFEFADGLLGACKCDEARRVSSTLLQLFGTFTTQRL